MATTRERLRELLDALPDDRLTEAEMALRTLAILEDDEPLTDEDWEAIRQGREEYRRGETISGDDIRREFGF